VFVTHTIKATPAKSHTLIDVDALKRKGSIKKINDEEASPSPLIDVDALKRTGSIKKLPKKAKRSKATRPPVLIKMDPPSPEPKFSIFKGPIYVHIEHSNHCSSYTINTMLAVQFLHEYYPFHMTQVLPRFDSNCDHLRVEGLHHFEVSISLDGLEFISVWNMSVDGRYNDSKRMKLNDRIEECLFMKF
jgi:hypothetical protein